MYKARIKILVARGGHRRRSARQVEEEFSHVKGGVLHLPQDELDRIAAYFAAPDFELLNQTTIDVAREKILDPTYGRWLERNLHAAQAAGLCLVTISLKPIGGTPGDATAEQMDVVADLAERYSLSTRCASPTSRTSSCRT